MTVGRPVHRYRSWGCVVRAPTWQGPATALYPRQGTPTLEAWKRAASTATELSTAPAPTNVRPRPKLFRAVSRAEVHLPSREGSFACQCSP